MHRLLPLATLLLSACDKSSPQTEAWINAAKEAEERIEMEAKIEELEREIESSEQIISDLEAAVQMEKTKLEDDPNYDQSFLNEIFADQDLEREDIRKAREELDALKQ